MTQPQQPQTPPSEGAPSDVNPGGQTPNGIPAGAEEHEAKGTPNSDRHKTETTPNT